MGGDEGNILMFALDGRFEIDFTWRDYKMDIAAKYSGDISRRDLGFGSWLEQSDS